MLGMKFARLIERDSDKLAESLVHQLHTHERTRSFRNIHSADLRDEIHELYFEFLQSLDEFFDRATYHAITGYIHHQAKEFAKTSPLQTHA